MHRKNDRRTNLLIGDDFVHIADANLASELVGRLSIHSGHQTRIVEKSERSLELCQPPFFSYLNANRSSIQAIAKVHVLDDVLRSTVDNRLGLIWPLVGPFLHLKRTVDKD